MPVWLERRDIDYHHEVLVGSYGGLSGQAGDDCIEATLARALQHFQYNPKSTVFELAAAYGFGFARNHCFPDGNKRVALSSIDVFLMLNDYDLQADPADAVVMINAVAAGECTQEELGNWIEANSLPLGDEF